MTSRLEEGHTLGECMREADCLPDILVDMTAVGEETGELESTLPIALIFKLYANTEKGRMNVAKLALKIPVLGNVSLLSAASEFAANLTTLIGAGLQLTRAVSITARVINNYYISQCVGKMTSRLEEGHTLGECMREADCLPDILVDMTAVGEETGELESTLHTVSGYYESELDMAVQDVLKKLEPTLLIGMAVIAGYIVLAVYIAMFQMYSVM